MIPRLWAVLGLLALLSASHVVVYRFGRGDGRAVERALQDAARAKLQAQLFELADRHSEAAARLAALQAEQDTLVEDFENDARTDAGAAGRRPDPADLRELESLWRRARAAP